MDFTLASFLLVLLAPFLLLIAFIIKVDTPGPVFFVQERVSVRRRLFQRGSRNAWEICLFRMVKFRSMYRNADVKLHQEFTKAYLQGLPGSTEVVTDKVPNDPRITRFGKILRKTSVDELPQLINVIKGEMSLVGPRPVPLYEALDYTERHMQRFNTLPGISGFYQVLGRGRLDFEGMIRLDLEYLKKQSIFFDLRIMVQTVPAVLLGKGAE